MAEAKQKNRKKQSRTFEAPIEPAFNLRLVQQNAKPADDKSGLPGEENDATLTINPPESGLLSRLIERISKL